MSTVQERPQSQEEHEQPPTWFQAFWRRYSPSGEFPISSAASVALHILVGVSLALGLGSLANRAQRPPSVSSVMVGDGDSAAPGFGEDGLPPGDGTLETGAAAGEAGGPGVGGGGPSTPTPEVVTGAEVKDVEAFQPTETVTSTSSSAAGQAARSVSGAKAAASSAGSRLADAKSMLNKNLGGGGGGGTGVGGGNGTGGGKGQGGGGGTGLTGRAAQQARWILQFQTASTQDYLAQFEGLGASIAFPAQGNQWKFFSQPSSNPSNSTLRDLSNENRLYWIDENPRNVTGVAAALGVQASREMILFLPLELEQRMLKMELSYRGLKEEDIQSTTFGVSRGAGYDVRVVDQVQRK